MDLFVMTTRPEVRVRREVPFPKSSQKDCDEIIKVIYQKVGAKGRLFSYPATRFALYTLIYNPLKKVYGDKGASYVVHKIGYSDEDKEWVLGMCSSDISKMREWRGLLRPRLLDVCGVFRDANVAGDTFKAIEEIEKAITCKKRWIFNLM
jgi:hypothetical protein